MRTLTLLLILFSFLNTNTAQVYVNLNATGNNDGTSWTDAYTDFQEALDSSVAGSQIWVAAGIYTPAPGPTQDSTSFISPQQYEIYGGFVGTETILEDRDWETNLTILSGDLNGDDIPGDYFTNRADNARNVLASTGSGVTTVFDGLTFTNGNGRMDEIPMGTTNFFPWLGAGLSAAGEAHIRNCTFSENIGSFGCALFIGFGISNDFILDNCTFINNFSDFGTIRIGNTQSAQISNSTFENNAAITFGAALVIGNGNANIEDCSFSNNSVTNGIGGGLFIFQNSGSAIPSTLVEVINSDFIANTAPAGAGIGFNNFFPESQILIDSCLFSENLGSSPNAYGAGIALQNYEDGFGGTIPSLAASIQNSVIESNASSFGSGLYFASFSDVASLNMSNCLVDSNVASDAFAGVGIVNNNVFINANFTNVTFEDNVTTGDAGALGMFNASDDSPMQYLLDSCTFEANIADGFGGAIWSSSPASNSPGPEGLISKTTFTDNEGKDCCGAIYSGGEQLVIDKSLFSGNTTDGTDNDINGGGAIAIDYEGLIRIKNSVFEENESQAEGAALFVTDDDSKVFIENSLIAKNIGASTIMNQDSLWLTNVTMTYNDAGLAQIEEGHVQLQNTIIENDGDNYTSADSTGIIVSLGGNLSSDETMTNALIGSGPYLDFNNISAELGIDNVPLVTSPCVDAGNSDNILFTLDLAGEERFQGVTLDIGAFESSFDTPVRELNALKIEVYPNPFVSELQLSSLENIEQIRLLDGVGKFVQSFPIENTLYVNSALAQGIYYLEVTIGNQIYFKKLNKK